MENDPSDELSELRAQVSGLDREALIGVLLAERQRRERADDHIRKIKEMTLNFWDWSAGDYPLGPEEPEGPLVMGRAKRFRLAAGGP